MKGFAVRDLYESFARANNAEQSDQHRRIANKLFAAKVIGLVEAKKLSYADFSFKELWEALVVSQGLEENLVSSAFPNISGQIISNVMIEGYNLFPKEGLKLVRVVPSKLKTSLVAGWTAIGTIREVREKEDYLEVIPPDEKTVRIVNKKYGGLISLTKEDIFFDRTGELINRARSIGEEGARFQDQLIMEGVIDKNGTVYDKGILYESDQSNVNTGAASALGTTGFENCYINLLNKTDEQSKKIWVLSDKLQLMCAPALLPTAWKLQNNEYGPQGTANLDKNFAQGKFDIIVNPYQTTTTRWHMGSFKRQFRWEEVWPIETFMRVGPDSEDGFKKDVIQSHKISLYGGVGADDFRYVEQNNGV